MAKRQSISTIAAIELNKALSGHGEALQDAGRWQQAT
jgi:hypothetical protein